MARPNDLTGKTGVPGSIGPAPSPFNFSKNKPGPASDKGGKGGPGGSGPAMKSNSAGKAKGGAGGSSARPKV
jgi:hypothetical protein